MHRKMVRYIILLIGSLILKQVSFTVLSTSTPILQEKNRQCAGTDCASSCRMNQITC